MTNTTKPTVDDLGDTRCRIVCPPIVDDEYGKTLEDCKGKFTQAMEFTGFPRLPAQPCEACHNEGSCKTINQCLRYKCEFGKVDKP